MPERSALATGSNAPGVHRSALVVASIPGRLRLRDRRWRGSPRCLDLAARLRAVEGVLAAEPTVAAGSVLVRYDPSRWTVSGIEEALVAEVHSAFPDVAAAPPAAAAPTPAEPGISRREMARRWNRFAKLGMLASFPVSLALAAAGGKKLHAATGGVFSLLMLVHLLVHRRHLVK